MEKIISRANLGQTTFLPKTGSLSFKGPLSDLRQILKTVSPLKMMKNAYSMLNVFLVPQIATFLSCFDYVGKRLDKLCLISKFMTPKAGEQIITIHIFPNISRRQSGSGTCSVDVIKRAIFFN